jgi:peptidoglycan/xylan/chitin deacetylase (PgdA/CDA1 family)
VTVSGSAVALELNPPLCQWMRDGSHDLMGHGWRWIEAWHQTREEEREHLGRAIASYQRALGSRPVGWNCRSWPTENTRELLVQEGGFIYDSDVCADDLPYYASCAGRPWLVVPYSKTYNDSRFVTTPGFTGPRDFLDTLTMGLDQLVYEGRTAMMTVAVHARWSGQAGRAAALRHFIAHAQSTPGVSFMRRSDIARWWLERYPAPS